MRRSHIPKVTGVYAFNQLDPNAGLDGQGGVLRGVQRQISKRELTKKVVGTRLFQLIKESPAHKSFRSYHAQLEAPEYPGAFATSVPLRLPC